MNRITVFILVIMFFSQHPAFPGSDLEVGGVFHSDKPKAVVDGNLVGEGDKIGEAEIVEIGQDYVKFKRGDTVITKDVGEKTFKSKAKGKFEEFKEKIMNLFIKKKNESVPSQRTARATKKGRLEEALGNYMKAQEDLIEVQKRDKRAREAIKRKIEAVRGTGLERMIDPDAWDED
jgi:hypothetical protein